MLLSEPECRDSPFSQKRRHRGMEAGAGSVCVPRTEVKLAFRLAGTDQQNVALFYGQSLLALGALEVLGEHVLPRLQPGNPAEPGNVEQHSASDQAVLEHIDGIGRGPLGSHAGTRLAVVEHAADGNVAEGVDVAVRGVVVIGADVILGKAERFRPDVLVD